MRKIIAAINMTLDGFCDHTGMAADDELHQHYQELLSHAGVILYGRVTYELMEFWRTVIEKPTGNKATDEFALAMDKVPKIIFSRTLKTLDWHSAKLATKSLKEEVEDLRQSRIEEARNIYVGSPGLIATLTQLGLIDEYQLCIHPVILGKGLPLFKNLQERTNLRLQGTKTFSSGSMLLYYARQNEV